MFDDFNVEAIGVFFKLLDSGGTKGITGSHDDTELMLLKIMSKFSNRGCFSCSVNAKESDDVGFILSFTLYKTRNIYEKQLVFHDT